MRLWLRAVCCVECKAETHLALTLSARALEPRARLVLAWGQTLQLESYALTTSLRRCRAVERNDLAIVHLDAAGPIACVHIARRGNAQPR